MGSETFFYLGEFETQRAQGATARAEALASRMVRSQLREGNPPEAPERVAGSPSPQNAIAIRPRVVVGVRIEGAEFRSTRDPEACASPEFGA